VAGPRIVVVEEEPDLGVYLEMHHYDVVHASDAARAVTMVCTSPSPALVLLDVVDGDTVLRGNRAASCSAGPITPWRANGRVRTVSPPWMASC
jgi:DNA-binding response OmpR family regulator